ncbi:cytochrome P450 [Streptomyces canarius]
MTSLPLASPDELDELDFADPRLHAEHDLTEVWRRLRAERPFHRQPARGSRPGFWVITRYADVVEVYRSREFTTEHGNSLPTLLTGGDAAAGTLLAVTDGLRHQRIRAILTRAFSPRVLAAVQEGVRRTADELVAAAVAKGEADFVRDVAANIPLGAVFDLLGVARGDRQYLLGLVSRAGRSRHADAPPEDSWTAESEILLYFADLARTRRGGDGDDVVSLLANCRVDGEPLSDAELMADCYGLLTGGDETGRHAISGGLLALIGNPEQWDALRSGALDLRVAADEVLRWTVPSLHGGRTATADVEVNGDPEQLTDRELALAVLPVFGAGVTTLSDTLGNIMHTLLTNPDQLERLSADPARAERAAAEAFRHSGGYHITRRYATRDTEIRGVPVAAGSIVVLLLAGANRDPEVFARPEELDIERPETASLAFGTGIHHCLGAALAKLLVETVCGALHRGPALRPAGAPRWRPSLLFFGPVRLPVTVVAGPRTARPAR